MNAPVRLRSARAAQKGKVVVPCLALRHFPISAHSAFYVAFFLNAKINHNIQLVGEGE